MGHWLELARLLNAQTEETELTELTPNKRSTGTTPAEVSSVNSVKSEGAIVLPLSEQIGEQRIIQAIRSGANRHGPIAVASGLGATRTYQLIEQMKASGRLAIKPDGIIGIPGS